ncbi:hypothetical protein ABID62_009288 [Bradyrhizobium sp. S3.9.1]
MIQVSSADHNEPIVKISKGLFDRMRKVMTTQILVGLDEELQENIRQLVVAAYLEGRRSVMGEDS